MPWVLNVAYLFAIAAALPILLYRMAVHKKYRDGWGEKFLGRLPRSPASINGAPPAGCVWLHAVSVGEVLQLEPLVRELAHRRPDLRFVISTTTSTGYALAQRKFEGHQVCYFPLDFSWSVGRALERVRPSVVVLVELELWPNFIFRAHRLGIPVALVNGRISQRSFSRYRLARPLMARLLARLGVIAVQNKAYADRLIELGAPEQRVRITGSIKFDRVVSDRKNPKTEELRRSFGLREGQRVFIAGSTQAPEEELALNAYLALAGEFPGLRLVLVPRHKERFEEVARLIARRGLPLIRRSLAANSSAGETRSAAASADAAADAPADAAVPASTPARSEPSAAAHPGVPPILLLDTLGELSACWGLADVAFVGGSLTNRGGQNMIEPAAYGAAVLFGPNTWNFRDVVEILLGHGAARVVADGDDLTGAVRALLSDRESAERLGRTAQELVLAQQGATSRTVDLVSRLLPAARESRAVSRPHAA